MSMTKRYLESLPKEQQDNILGLPPDEWTESAENEPTEEELKRARIEAQLERAEAPLRKPVGPCVRLKAADGVIWEL